MQLALKIGLSVTMKKHYKNVIFNMAVKAKQDKTRQGQTEDEQQQQMLKVYKLSIF